MSTMPMNGGYADYDLENQQLERRRKMAEMLAAQSGQAMPAGQMVGNQYVPTSWTQHLAQALKGPLAERELSQLDARQKELGERKQNDMRTEMERFAAALQGKEAQTFQPATPNDDEGNAIPSATSEAVAPNIKLAQQLAIGAKNPMLKQWGMAQMMPKTPQWKEAKIRGADGSERVGYVDINSPNPEATFRSLGTQPVKREFVNGVGVNPYTGEPQGQAIPKQAPAPNVASDLLIPDGKGGYTVNTQLVGVKKEIANAGKPTMTSTIINAGPKEFEKELAKLDAKQLDALRANADAANNSLTTVQNLRDAVKQGVYSGGGANAKMLAANLINGMTGATPKSLPGSQLFNAEASKLVLDHVKALGANPSNADRDFIEKTVPMLATSPQARDQMINFIEAKATKTLDVYRRADAYARKNHSLGGFDLFPQQGGNDVRSQADAIIGR